MGLKLHNARRSYERRGLYLRLQNDRNLLAHEVHFLSSAVPDGDIHGLTEIIGFVEPSKKILNFVEKLFQCKKK